jgi:hypothetical protein
VSSANWAFEKMANDIADIKEKHKREAVAIDQRQQFGDPIARSGALEPMQDFSLPLQRATLSHGQIECPLLPQ